MNSSALAEAFDKVQALASDFKANEKHYLSSEYQEAEVRKDFIDKFFIALGWDVNHDYQKNPYEQEVKVERTDGLSKRRADYAFRLAPNFRDVRFYVEAKKPHGDIASADNYFQTIRYGWNSQTPIAVLTDFEQFQVIDCRYKPNIDTVLNHCIKKYHYSDYANLDKFSEIYFLFSRESIADKSIDKFSDSLPTRRGTAIQRKLYAGGYQTIDESFLEQLDQYRTTLAHAFKKGNPRLDGLTLTELTQRTLDRLVFIRFLEDKLIEPHHLVSQFGEHGTAWQDFVATSHRLDGIYNGIVFKKHDILDSPTLKLDDGQFTDICEDLAHANSPYDFNAIPIHILGSIYERFLGKIIVSKNKDVTVEEKPEVRKAGGVYYTPDYIVGYIVEGTIGKLIAGKTPSQIANMRFIDISCGSGSFLLGVYDLLLRYHTAYYNANPSKAKKGECLEKDGVMHLSLKKKREILLNNVYGADIDPQAVEVAQLSVYLKLLEEETTASAREHQLEFHETLLPSLNRNIICGNSVMASDVLEGRLFGADEERKLNPMSYEDRFPAIIRSGGFDAVIGNPPWISLSGKFGNEIHTDSEIEYLTRRFNGNTYMPNMYEYFVAQGLNLTKPGGYFGYIVPDRLGFNSQFVSLRKRMLQESQIIDLVYKVPFPGITADTLIFVVRKGSPALDVSARVSEYGKASLKIPQRKFLEHPSYSFEYFENAASQKLINKLGNMKFFHPLSHFCQSTSGYGGKSSLITEERQNTRQIPTIKGDSIGRYENRKSYWFEFKKDNITGRTTDKNKLGAKPKILMRKTGDQIIATFDESGVYPEQSLYFLYDFLSGLDPKFILGILNSRLMAFYYRARALTNKKSIAQVKKVDLDILPFPPIDLSSKEDKAIHDRFVRLVDQILESKHHLTKVERERDKNYYQSKCDSLDRQIDLLVYGIYKVAAKDIEQIESAPSEQSSVPDSSGLWTTQDQSPQGKISRV